MAPGPAMTFLFSIAFTVMAWNVSANIRSKRNDNVNTVLHPPTCAQDMIEWCRSLNLATLHKGSEFSYQGSKISYQAGNFYEFHLFCNNPQSGGIACSFGQSKWFGCAPGNIMMFNGEVLTSDTADEDVCSARNGYFEALREQQVEQNMLYKSMMGIRTEMNNMNLQMNNMFGKGFPFQNTWYPVQPFWNRW